MIDDTLGSMALSPRQFRELLLTFIVGMHVRRRAMEARDEEREDLEELERHLLSLAAGFGAEDLVERSEDGLYPGRAAEDLCHDILNEHNNDEFWSRLEHDLAFRDYLAGLSAEARMLANRTGERPPIELLDKYVKEFDKYGLDRLVIDPERKALEE